MKKFFSFAIVAAGLLVASCGNKAAAPAAEVAEQTEDSVAAAPAEEQPASLADIVAKAEAEGANWSADEWKAQVKKAIEAYKPCAVAMNEAAPADMEEVIKKYSDFPGLLKKMTELAGKTENGKVITEEWIQSTMEELGVPHM